MSISAIVTAGDRGAALPVYGESKVYLEVAGRPLVAHVVASLQRVPEISEVWVVGDEARLQAALGREDLQRELRKPLHLVPQWRNLYENAWNTYRRLLPGAGAEGRDPSPDESERRVLYVSGDLPFATPQEISQFVERASALDCDYVLGLVTEESLRDFYPPSPGAPGIQMAYFNLREGRFRQSNLHLVKPARVGNRSTIEQMYEQRHQKELGSILLLAWRLLISERGGLAVLYYYALMHLTGLADRRGWPRLADFLRRGIRLGRLERGCSDLLRTEFRFAVTDVGGCAIDIDNEHDWDMVLERFPEWSRAQAQKAERLCGPLPLPERAATGGR